MTPSPSAFALERLEYVAATAERALLRVRGRWDPRPPGEPPDLVVRRGERAQRIAPLPAPPAPPGRGPAVWQGAFAVAVEAVEDASATFWLQPRDGPAVQLPPPSRETRGQLEEQRLELAHRLRSERAEGRRALAARTQALEETRLMLDESRAQLAGLHEEMARKRAEATHRSDQARGRTRALEVRARAAEERLAAAEERAARSDQRAEDEARRAAATAAQAEHAEVRASELGAIAAAAGTAAEAAAQEQRRLEERLERERADLASSAERLSRQAVAVEGIERRLADLVIRAADLADREDGAASAATALIAAAEETESLRARLQAASRTQAERDEPAAESRRPSGEDAQGRVEFLEAELLLVQSRAMVMEEAAAESERRTGELLAALDALRHHIAQDAGDLRAGRALVARAQTMSAEGQAETGRAGPSAAPGAQARRSRSLRSPR